jgi:hypothetical protein
MDILSIALIVFAVIELSNVLILYFFPGTTRGNGVGIFKAFEKSKSDPEVHALIVYLVNWVAGTKLIFILLLIGIIITGTPATKIFSATALIVSISTFFYRLYPTIKKMDKSGQLTLKGYSRTLAIMISGFIGVFTVTLVIYLINLGRA